MKKMFRTIDMYKNLPSGTSLFPTSTNFEFWDDVYKNADKAVYDREFVRRYSGFRYYDFMEADTVSDAIADFKADVLSVLTINQKKYAEMYRIFLLTDEEMPITYNYDMTETTGAQHSETNYGATSETLGARHEETEYGATSATEGARHESTEYGATSETLGAQHEETEYGATHSEVQYGSTSETLGAKHEETEYGATQFTKGQQENTDGAVTNSHNVAPFNSSTVQAEYEDVKTSQTITEGQRIDSNIAHTDEFDADAVTNTALAHTDETDGDAHTDSIDRDAVTNTALAHTDEFDSDAVTNTTLAHTDEFDADAVTNTALAHKDETDSDEWTLTRRGNIGTQTAADVARSFVNFFDNDFKFMSMIFEDICKQLLLIGDC